MLAQVDECDEALAVEGGGRVLPVTEAQEVQIRVGKSAGAELDGQRISMRTVRQFVGRRVAASLSVQGVVGEAVATVEGTEPVFQRLQSSWNVFPEQHDLLVRPLLHVLVRGTLGSRRCLRRVAASESCARD